MPNNADWRGRFSHITDANRRTYAENLYQQSGYQEGSGQNYSFDWSGYNPSQTYVPFDYNQNSTNPAASSNQYTQQLSDLQDQIAMAFDGAEVDLEEITRQREALEARREASISDIERAAAEETRTRRRSQEGEVGASTLFLGGAGALGRTGSGMSILQKQASRHADEISAIDAKKQQLINQAKQAYESKDFEMAKFYMTSAQELRQQRVELYNNLQDNLIKIAKFERMETQSEYQEWEQNLTQMKERANQLAPSLLSADGQAASFDIIQQYAEQYQIDPYVLLNATKQYGKQETEYRQSQEKIEAEINKLNTQGGSWMTTQLDDGTVIAYDKTDPDNFNFKNIGKFPKPAQHQFKTDQGTGISGTFDPQTGIWKPIDSEVSGQQLQGSDLGSLVLPESQREPSSQLGNMDFSSYAEDKDWGGKVNTIHQGLPDFTSMEDVDSYIQSKYSDSPITGEMIANVSGQYDIDPYWLISLLQQESDIGTSPVAQKNNNVGGITWNANFPEEMKGTARPSKEKGNYVKFQSIEQGLQYVAQNMSRRKTDGSFTHVSDKELNVQDKRTGYDSLNPKEKKEFDKLITKQKDYLSKNFGKPKPQGQKSYWGIAWDKVKDAFSNMPNKEIDDQLDKDQYYEQSWKQEKENKRSLMDLLDEEDIDKEDKKDKKESWWKRLLRLSPRFKNMK